MQSEKLIVTLTSYPPRFNTLPAVLDSIFSQTIKPDKVVLNLSEGDTVPEKLQNYINMHGIEVNRVPDTKVYKKLIPTLRKYPDDCVISIDDDWIYPSGMIEDFLTVHKKHPESPVSGNRERHFGLQCHCGCASLTKAEYFGQFLDCIDEDVIENCQSDDIVYTFFITRNGKRYLNTRDEYFKNMQSIDNETSYSAQFPDSIASTFEYLEGRFSKKRIKMLVILRINEGQGMQIHYFISKMKNICGCDWNLVVIGGENISGKQADELKKLSPDTRFLDYEPDFSGYDYILRLSTLENHIDAGGNHHSHFENFWLRNMLTDSLLSSPEAFLKIIRHIQKHPETSFICGRIGYSAPPRIHIRLKEEDFLHSISISKCSTGQGKVLSVKSRHPFSMNNARDAYRYIFCQGKYGTDTERRKFIFGFQVMVKQLP